MRPWRVASTIAGLYSALAISGSLGHDVPRSPAVTATGKLTVANTLDFAPFEFIDADGRPAGIIVELASAVAELVDADLDLHRMPFTAMIPGLMAGRFSIAWETFSVTEDRLRQVSFVVFLKGGLAISTRPDLVDAFSGEMPLCGRSLGVSVGSASDQLVDALDTQCSAAGRPAIRKSVFNGSQDIVQAVLSGRLDGRVDDATVSSYFELTSGGQLVVLPMQYETMPLGLAIPRSDSATADMLVSALTVLFENGTYARVLEKYGMSRYGIAEPYFVDALDDLRVE